MDAGTQPTHPLNRIRTAVPAVPGSVVFLGLCLGALTGAALWALRPEVCAAFCSVHAFLAATVALALGLYVALGRREGLPTALTFAMSFGAGVMLVALVVSAARISNVTDDGFVEPVARHALDRLPLA